MAGRSGDLKRHIAGGIAILAAFAAAAAASERRSAPLEERTSAYSALRYDREYPTIAYSGPARHNEIARLQEKLDRGEIRLTWKAPRGYLDSLLEALDIDPSSQVLVYSKTSLQFLHINAAKPRAIYFNDDTYIAWVQDSDLLEISTMDALKGAVFYTLANRSDESVKMERETARCLTCHDTFSNMGGGVPRFLLLSGIVGVEGALLADRVAVETTPETPISERWGGWYVTGQHGSQVHLGNLLIRDERELDSLDNVRRGNLQSLAGLFDTRPYLTDKSDIVALMVLEHQLHVKNLITRLNYKARTFVARELGESPREPVTLEKLSEETRKRITAMMEQVVQAMLSIGEAELTDQIRSSSGYDEWFRAKGPADAQGRSLRDFDLRERLFRYPLSYVVYSEGFDALPDYARAYIYERFEQVLGGRDRSGPYAQLDPDAARAALEILRATKPEFRRHAGRS